MLSTAADADNGVGKVRGESEFPGTITNLVWALAVNQRFCDDEARSKCADSSVGGVGHSRHIPFNNCRSVNRDRCQPTAIASSAPRVEIACGKRLITVS